MRGESTPRTSTQKRSRTRFVVALGLALTACGLPVCRDTCDSSSKPVQGTTAMFSSSGVEGDGYRIGDLTRCGTSPEHFTKVTGTGTEYAGIPLDEGCRPLSGTEATSDCSVTIDSLRIEISTRLEERGVTDSLTGLGTVCPNENLSGLRVQIHDYGTADLAAEAIGDVLEDAALADSVYLVIGPRHVACADSGCG
jgi:hypothetical protein